MEAAVAAVRFLSMILSFAVIAQVLVGFFLSPYHPIRRSLDSLVEPMLAPIRRILPTAGPLDFSPMVLLFLIFLIERLLVGILVAAG